jgi:hypothetical protein
MEEGPGEGVKMQHEGRGNPPFFISRTVPIGATGSQSYNPMTRQAMGLPLANTQILRHPYTKPQCEKNRRRPSTQHLQQNDKLREVNN